jgi:RNA polymerase sigma factor (sigma-70 family)
MNPNELSKGDMINARNALVLSHLAVAWRTAWVAKRRLPKHIQLDDLFQSAVLGLIKAAAAFDMERESSFGAFAFKHALGAAIDSVRGAQYREEAALAMEAVAPYTSPEVEGHLSMSQISRILWRILPILDQRARTVIHFRYWHDMALSRIARRLRISVGQVSEHHRVALSDLKRELGRRIHIHAQGPGPIGQLLVLTCVFERGVGRGRSRNCVS